MSGDKVEFNTPDEQPTPAPSFDNAKTVKAPAKKDTGAKDDDKWTPFQWETKSK